MSVFRESASMTVAGPLFHGGMGWTPLAGEEVAGLLPGYEVLSLLGCGGMGVVYLALQTALDPPVAVKLLPLEVSGDGEFARRFVQEARAMARLSHPHIAHVYDSGTTAAGHLYYVMEFVDGCSLQSMIEAGGMSPERALEIAGQVCGALACAHGQGIVHRDVKPANVLLDQNGAVKVADFGIARVLGPGGGGFTLTRTGRYLGTPDYIAPEQIRDAEEVDHRADIFSVGVMLYEMLCGETPRGVFPPPSQRVRCGTRVDAIVHKAMQQAPERRFQRTEELMGAVEFARRHPRRNVWPWQRKLAVTVLPALAALTVTMAAGRHLLPDEKKPPAAPAVVMPTSSESAPSLRETAAWLFLAGGPGSSLTLSRPGTERLEVKSRAALPEGEDWQIVELWLDRFHSRGADPPVTRDEFVRHTAGLRHLRQVFFRCLYLHDRDFAFLAANPALEVIRIEVTPVTDSLLSSLSGLKKVRTLNISGAPGFTGRGIGQLACLPVLEDLAVAQTGFDDAAVRIIAACPRLRVVGLSLTAVTDESLRLLRNHPRLEELYVERTAVSDAGAAGLAGLKNLKKLSVSGMRENTLAALRAALPECRVGARP